MKIKERLLLLSVLPQQGSFLTMQAVSEIRGKVALSPDEIAAVNGKDNPNGTISWEQDKDPDKDVPLSTTERSIITKALVDKDSAGTLSADHVPLYEEFVLTKGNDNGKS